MSSFECVKKNMKKKERSVIIATGRACRSLIWIVPKSTTTVCFVSLFCVLCDWIGLLSLFALLCAHRLPIALRRDQRMCFSFSVQKNIPPMGCRFDFFNILRLHLCFFLFVRMHLFHQSRPLFLCTSSVVIQLVYIGVYTSFPLPRMYRRNG